MNGERYIRAIAGIFVLLSLGLGYLVSPYWYLFTAFVGLNLLQSAFTQWCLMEKFLLRLGVARPSAGPKHLRNRVAMVFAAGVALLLASAEGLAQPPGKGPPPGKGQGMGKRMGQDQTFADDRDVFHFLLTHRADIKRTVTETKTGVETITESNKPEVAKKIQEHVTAMHERVKSGKGIHYRDPLFEELFKHYDKITMTVEKTAKGVKVTESSKDAYVVKLIQAHARVVTKFIEHGHEEVRKNHPLPERAELKKP
jgi:hypothetical protein